jgi:hypothetical protein
MLTEKENLMKRFKVKVRGENFLLNFNGEFKKYGFHATRFVKAENAKEAQKIAVILAHQNPILRNSVLNEDADRPAVKLEEIEEVGFFKFFTKKSTNDFTFYPEDED